MRYADLMTETAIPQVDDVTLRQAAEDFRNDWLQMERNEETQEPQPRHDMIATLRRQGLDPDTSPKDVLIAALVALMRPEAHRFLQSLNWQNGQLTVYRSIEAPAGWERDPTRHRGLGVFWAVTNTWSGNTTIVSAVRPGQIDWRIVMLKHLTYSENEIRVKDNQKVPILHVYVLQDGHRIERDVRHLAGKLFSVGVRGDDWLD